MVCDTNENLSNCLGSRILESKVAYKNFTEQENNHKYVIKLVKLNRKLK